jgi:carboxymethylenebutenolidase
MNDRADFDSLVPALALDRRGFLVSALGAGFALAVQPVAADTAISTDCKDLVAGEVSVPTADGMMPAYRAHPAQGADFPVVLVVQEIFGVHEHIKDVCRRLAKLGYLALAPELYARQGDPRQYSAIPDILAKVVSRVPDAQVLADLDACVAWARGNGGDPGRLAVTGFCWGGRITWLYAAHNPGLKAAVAWYGRLAGNATELTPRQPLDVAAELKAPVLGLYGGLDQGIPLDTVERMRKAMAESANPASRASDILVYHDAPHAFHADYRPSYRKDAAEDGWRRMHEWLRRHGV